MKKLSEVAPKIIDQETREEIPFTQFLEDQAGTGELYTPEIGEMLAAALHPHTTWTEALDYLAPIAREIISDAVQLDDKKIYLQLVTALRDAWKQLCEHPNWDKAAARHYVLNPADPEFQDNIKRMLDDLAYTRTVVKEYTVEPTGTYRIVVGFPSE